MQSRLTCRGDSSPATAARTFQNAREDSTACKLPFSAGFDARKFFPDDMDCVVIFGIPRARVLRIPPQQLSRERCLFPRPLHVLHERGLGTVSPREPDVALHSVVAGRNWIIRCLIFNVRSVLYFFRLFFLFTCRYEHDI